MKNNVLQGKSFEFAVRIVKLVQYLKYDLKQYELGSQLIRAGTSIGANVEEAIGAQSRRDFVSKICVARKEARETHYWLRLVGASEIIPEERLVPLTQECDELIRIMNSIILTINEEINESIELYDTERHFFSDHPIRNS